MTYNSPCWPLKLFIWYYKNKLLKENVVGRAETLKGFCRMGENEFVYYSLKRLDETSQKQNL